jgi:hypothetical protein
MPKKDDPLTASEMKEACEQFFPLFEIVLDFMPSGSKTEDALKVMETVAKLGHKNRARNKEKDDLKFGFNKIEEPDDA